MRKEIPWTLEEKPKKFSSSKKPHTHSDKENIAETVENFFEKNKNKSFTCSDVVAEVNKGKVTVCLAISQLKDKGVIKIVDFIHSNTLVPIYQHKNGKRRAIEVIDFNDKKKSKGLVTLRTFRDETKITNSTKFSYLISRSKIPSKIVKNWSNFCYAYKRKDLEQVLETYNKTTNIRKKGNKVIQINIFKWTVIITKK